METRLRKVRVVVYERNGSGREVPITKAGLVDMNQVEYMEEDWISSIGDCVIVRLVSGKEFTIVGTIQTLMQGV